MTTRRRHSQSPRDLSSIQFSKQGISTIKRKKRPDESYEEYIRRRLRL